MAFIKIQNFVINTTYVTVKLKSKVSFGEKSVSVLIATLKFPFFELKSVTPNYHHKWIEFTGQTANVLQDYFKSFNSVIDLLAQF